MGFLGQPSASVKRLSGMGRERMGLVLEFSKPVRLVEKRAHGGNARFVRSHATRADSVIAADVDSGSAPPAVAFEDGQAILRARLARLFAADAQLRVVSQAENGPDTGERTLQLTPDSVLLDVWVPTIADGHPQNPTNQQSPMLKVVVLATNFGPETARAANGRPAVSKRELSILAHVADGQSNKQIGRLLGISTQTVRNHLSRIFHKLGVSNRTEAVMSAMRLRLLIV